MDVEVEVDREGSDVSHPRGPKFAREERERIGGENERKSVTWCEGMKVDMKTVNGQERIEGDDASETMGLQDGTRQKSVCLIVWGKWAMGATTVHICKVGMGGGTCGGWASGCSSLYLQPSRFVGFLKIKLFLKNKSQISEVGSQVFKVADYLKLRSIYNRGNIEDLLHNF